MSAVIVPYKEHYLSEMKEIFFESSSKKSFRDEEEKEKFFYKYLGFYLENYRDFAYVAVDSRVLGYVVASPVSSGENLEKIQPHLKVFDAQITKFPAHLHINCHHESRGKGIGSKLMAAIEEKLLASKIRGLHIMTAPNSPNQSFYKKLGFNDEVSEDFSGSSILLMGKKLSADTF